MPQATEETVATSEEQEDSSSALSDANDETGSEGESQAEEAPGESGSEAPGSTSADQEEVSLLSDEEYTALEANPKALRKALQRAYTQRMQTAAQAVRVMEALTKDPVTTIKQMAMLAGLRVQEPENKQELDEIHASLEAVLGPELAGQIKPVFEKLAERIAEKTTAPIKAAQERQLREAADNQTKMVLDQFNKKHPDWKKHEKAMMDIAGKLNANVNSGITQAEYTEFLYTLATAGEKSGDAAEEIVARVNENAGKTPGAGRGAPPKKVASGSGKAMSIREALQAAMRGEVVEEE